MFKLILSLILLIYIFSTQEAEAKNVNCIKLIQGQWPYETVDIRTPVIQKLLKDNKIPPKNGLKLLLLPDCKPYFTRKINQINYNFNIYAIFVNSSNKKIKLTTYGLTSNRIDSISTYLLFLKKNNKSILNKDYYKKLINKINSFPENIDFFSYYNKIIEYEEIGKRRHRDLSVINPNSAVLVKINIFTRLYGLQYNILEDLKNKLNKKKLDSIFIFFHGIPDLINIFNENEVADYKIKLYFNNEEQSSYFKNGIDTDVIINENERKTIELERLKRRDSLKNLWSGELESNEITIRTVMPPKKK